MARSLLRTAERAASKRASVYEHFHTTLLDTYIKKNKHPNERKRVVCWDLDRSPATCRLRVLSASCCHKMAEREETLPVSSAALLAHVSHKQRHKKHTPYHTYTPLSQTKTTRFPSDMLRSRSQTILSAFLKEIKRNLRLQRTRHIRHDWENDVPPPSVTRAYWLPCFVCTRISPYRAIWLAHGRRTAREQHLLANRSAGGGLIKATGSQCACYERQYLSSAINNN